MITTVLVCLIATYFAMDIQKKGHKTIIQNSRIKSTILIFNLQNKPINIILNIEVTEIRIKYACWAKEHDSQVLRNHSLHFISWSNVERNKTCTLIVIISHIFIDSFNFNLLTFNWLNAKVNDLRHVITRFNIGRSVELDWNKAWEIEYDRQADYARISRLPAHYCTGSFSSFFILDYIIILTISALSPVNF